MLPRHELPQIPSAKIDEFLDYIRDNGVRVVECMLPTIKLKPIQSHVNREKVDRLKETPDKLQLPIVISKHGHILDGHHRWIANKELSPDGSMNTAWCECSMRQLIELGHAFEHSFTRTIHELISPRLK